MMNTKVANDNGVPTSRVRHELNTARFSWYHVKAILVAGVGCGCPAACHGCVLALRCRAFAMASA